MLPFLVDVHTLLIFSCCHKGYGLWKLMTFFIVTAVKTSSLTLVMTKLLIPYLSTVVPHNWYDHFLDFLSFLSPDGQCCRIYVMEWEESFCLLPLFVLVRCPTSYFYFYYQLTCLHYICLLMFPFLFYLSVTPAINLMRLISGDWSLPLFIAVIVHVLPLCRPLVTLASYIEVEVQILVGSRIFTSSYHPDWLWSPPSLLSDWCWRPLSQGVKWQERKADCSPPTSVEIKKTWVCTSIPPYAFMA
jgi:hypothetical protein